MPENRLTIGTRGSVLAKAQAESVRSKLASRYPELEIELRVIRTQGDKLVDTALAEMGGKGIFTKEIEQELLKGSIDLAVHSLKDLPTEQPEGLSIAAVTGREDGADVLVSKEGLKLAELPAGAQVLTGSLRRRAQLLHIRRDLQVAEVRGNVETRLRKLEAGAAAGLLMAAAGLARLGLADRISERLEPREFLPACGQGALAVEIRANNERVASLVTELDDEISRLTTTAERALLSHLQGGCQVPVGAYGWLENGQLHLRAMIASLDGVELITAEAVGTTDKPVELGREVAERLLGEGGREILERVRAEKRS